jgi:CheY-like chemotaxis protein
MGGTISVNSTIGEGSTFSFSIMTSAIANPIKEAAPDHERIVENLSALSERELNLEGKRILLICSNPHIGQAIVMYTKAWHICTQIAESGSEAMLLFESSNFDAVLIDENLGEMDALDLANDIHQIFPGLKLVLLTFVKTLSEAMDSERSKPRSPKFAAYINKPITSSKLYQTLINIFYPEQAKPIPNNVNSANISPSNPAKEIPLSVLIVEDNLVNQQLLSMMLKKLGYQAEAVNNGQKAVEAVTKKTYEIIFMDLQMPIMDGLTATTHIRQLPNRQPWIIGLSANSYAESHKSALAVGMDEYLAKPLTSENLSAALKRVPKTFIKEVPKEVSQKPPEPDTERSLPKPSNSSINLAIFTSIENAVGKENLSEVIDNYFSQAEREISNMRAAFNNQDIVTLEANNHSLKGGSGLFGATKLLKFCRSLQFMCRICIESNEYASNDVDQIGIVLQNIEEEYDLVKQALKALQ